MALCAVLVATKGLFFAFVLEVTPKSYRCVNPPPNTNTFSMHIGIKIE